MLKRYLIPLTLILIFVLAACSGGQPAEVSRSESAAAQAEMAGDEAMDSMAEDEAMDDMAGDEAMDDMAEDESMDDVSEHEATDDVAEGEAMDDMAAESMDENMPAAELAAWQMISLVNAATGEQFALADFQGKTVFVEPMATWCSNCRAQQGEVREAKGRLGDDVVFIGLSLETNLPPEELAAYAADNGFDWTYAVMPVELLSALSDEFGRSITNAPSTPHFIIRPDGSYSELSTGIDSADEIVALIES